MATEFTLDDLAKHLPQLRILSVRADPMSELLDHFRDGRQETLDWVERILASVGSEERRDPCQISPDERARIARASGVLTAEVDRFFTGFEQLQVRMAEMARLSLLDRLRLVFGGPGGMIYVIPWILVAGLVIARVFGW
jgi:signal recognition particle GTPase